MLTLKSEPDGFGFLYGGYVDGEGRHHRVDIMPPEPEWCGQVRMAEAPPHPTDWVIYIDGEEVARATSRADLDAALRALPARR